MKAARCAARAGKKEATDFAFQFLDQAVAKGCRDVDTLATEPDFAALRTDPRWKPVFEKALAKAAASRKGPLNADLERLFQEDQADRASDLDSTDWKAMEQHDADRRKRVLEILEKGGAREAGDYVHAAMVYQHSIEPANLDRANRYAAKAVGSSRLSRRPLARRRFQGPLPHVERQAPALRHPVQEGQGRSLVPLEVDPRSPTRSAPGGTCRLSPAPRPASRR